jgi:hypothetical protein
MSKRNEDSVERFFQKAVTQDDIPFRESDWQKMEKMLDERDAKAAAVRASHLRRAAYSLLILALIIPAAVYWLMPGDKTGAHQPEQAQVTGAETSGTAVTEPNPAHQVPAASSQQGNATATPQVSRHASTETQLHTDQSNPEGTTALPADTHEVNSNTNSVTSARPEKIQTLPSPPANQQNLAPPANAKGKAAVSSERQRYNALRNRSASTEHTGSSTQSQPASKEKASNRQQQAGISSPSSDISEAALNQTSARQLSETDGAVSPADEDKANTLNASSSIDEGSEKHSAALREAPLTAETPQVKPSDEKSDDTRGNTLNNGNTISDSKQTFPGTTPVVTRQQQDAPTNAVLPNAALPIEKHDDAGHAELVKSDDEHMREIRSNTPLQTENLVVKQPDGNITSVGTQPDRNSDSPVALTEAQEEVTADKPEKALSTDSIAERTSKKEEVLPEKNTVPSRWNVALVVAPDFTSTAMERYTAPGNAYGLTIGYRFFRRFSVSTGVIRTSKRYVGYGSEYDPPDGYWLNRTKGIIPDEISGKCKIIEIPLMVQYQFRTRTRSYFYAAAGVSSYILKSEAYKYSFENPPAGAAQGWSTSKSSTYPFAIGHISLAYERKVLPWLGIGLEPFLKIPFGGIGWSNVNLYSTGLFVNVRYIILKRETVSARK